MSRVYGLIGNPLSHSFSEQFFTDKFQRERITDARYKLFPLTEIEELTALLVAQPQLCGLNVTIPYKEAVLPYLHELDEAAREIGAVNCIRIADGKLKGYNTDAFAFETSLKAFLTLQPSCCFVMGTGGSSKAVCYALAQMQLPFIKVSRSEKQDCITYETMNAMQITDALFINTTPSGMLPNADAMPGIAQRFFNPGNLFFDLIYNPYETSFLKLARVAGAKTKNGLEMLHLQAEKSWEIWNS